MRAAWILCLVVVLFCALASSVPAIDMGRAAPPKPAPVGVYEGGGRQGGDTVADAFQIMDLPFTDSGTTCGYANDYDAACPYAGSTAPDVVYAYVAGADNHIEVNLCEAQYDSKVYVCEDDIANVIACNDDGCLGSQGLASRIMEMYLRAGHTYYFVVDGYGPACGDYTLSIQSVAQCVVSCPAGAQLEGEPPCVDDYVDDYNPGCCCADPPRFTPIRTDPDGTATMCGRACTFQYHGISYRDSDWYHIEARGPVTATCIAEFEVQFMIIYSGCSPDMQFVYTTADRCEPATLQWDFEPGSDCILWVGPTRFSGVPESKYVIEVSGRGASEVPEPGDPDVPRESDTWGRLKKLFL